MRALIFILILLPSLGFGQLTGYEKFNISLLPKYTKPFAAYSLAFTIQDKRRVVNWVNAKAEDYSNDKTYQLIAYLLKGKYERDNGETIKAIDTFSKAIKYFEDNQIEVDKKDVTRTLDTFLDIYDELADIYLFLGNFEQAEYYYKESLKVREANFRKGSLIVLRPKLGLADIEKAKGNMEQALNDYLELYNIMLYAVETWSFTIKYYRDIYINTGELYLEKRDYKNALKYAKLAEKRQKGLSSSKLTYLGSSKMMLVETYILMSRIFRESGDLGEAEESLEKAFTTFNENFTTELNEYSQLLKEKAIILHLQGDLNAAYTVAEEVMANHISFIGAMFSTLSEREKQNLYQRVYKDSELYYALAFELYKSTNDIDILRKVLSRRMETKGFLLNNLNKIKQSILLSGNQELIKVYEDWQSSKDLYSYYLYDDPKGPKLDSLTIEINNLERELSRQSEQAELASKPKTISEIELAIAPKTSLIEIIRYVGDADAVTYAFVIASRKNNSVEYKFLEKSFTTGEERKAQQYYNTNIKFERQDVNSFDELWQMVHDNFEKNSVNYLSADGIYNQINVNTLLIPETGKYVIDDYQVINITNIRDLTNTVSRTDHSSAVLFGRPTYDLSADYLHEYSDLESGLSRSNLFLEIEGFQEQQFVDLPGTSEEVNNISATLDKFDWEIKKYLGAEATEYRIKTIKDASVVHIATHGFFLEGESTVNPLLKSGLVMAGVSNASKNGDDGILTSYEVTNLNLDKTWLVVLSACETAVGDVMVGEGVYGLQRALNIAGAQNLIMSLWKVDDEATKELMTEFYRQLGEGSSIEEAFRKSQISIREHYPNPKYWGAFILIKAKFDQRS